jgi:sugar O-acyltransferase (sialic acid O-acetyltransferase NeuD family)
LIGSPVVGPVSRSSAIQHDAVIVAIGDNATRARVFLRLADAGEQMAIGAHPRSTVAGDVTLGPGSVVCAGVDDDVATDRGSGVDHRTGATVDHHSVIGAHVHIAPGVHMGGAVHVGDGALVGIGATVLPGVRIGEWSTVGAGAVVTADVPPHATVIGVPARVLTPAAAM